MKKLIVYCFVCLFQIGLLAQETESFVPFGLLMSDVIENIGQDRLEAIERLFLAIDDGSTDPDYLSLPAVYFFKIRELTFQEKYEEAKKTASELKRISPKIVSNLMPDASSWAFSLGLVSDGFIHWIKGELPLAQTYFDSANTINSGFYSNYYLGWMAKNEGDDDKALEYYVKADYGVTVMKYDRAEMLYKRGVIYHTRKLYAQAINDYTKSIEAYPLCKSYLERGRVYYFSSAYPDKSLAYDDFRGIIENCTDAKSLGPAYSFLAGDFYDKRQDAKALEYYKKAYELQGSYYDAGGVAIGYYALKDWSNTLIWSTRAIDGASQDSNPNTRALGDYYFYRGYANWQLQRMDDTVNDLLKARRYGHKTADDYLKQYFNR